MAKQRVILVGHCGIDGPRLQQEISSKAPDFDVTRINDLEELESACKEGADLLLVNREPVGFDAKDGVEIIRDVCRDYPGQRAMLVSDYPEAQEKAKSAGALPGFGKRELGTPRVAEMLRDALV